MFLNTTKGAVPGACLPDTRWKRMRYAGLVFAMVAAVAGAQEPSKTAEPLAVFAGQPIYESQIPSSDQAQLQRMMAQVYGVKLRGFHAVVDQKLLAAEAQRRGITVAQLLTEEVASKVPEPTEEAVHAYYVERQASLHQPYEAVKEEIRAGMRNMEIQKARAAYVQELYRKSVASGELQVMFKPPKPVITADPMRVRGAADAPITIVEFSDFSCPYCRKAEATVTELLARYPGKVKVSYRDFPLRDLHPNAELAAEASHCAEEQGKFWEFHDVLFAHQHDQDGEHMVEYAQGLGLDNAQFGSCLSSGKYKAQVEHDVQMGSASGVEATPGFFVQGTFVDGAQSADAFSKIIDEKLAGLAQEQPSGQSRAALKP